MPESNQPHHVIEGLIDAFNDHDIDRVLSFVMDDAELFVFPSTSIETGLTQFRDHLHAYFQVPNLTLRRMSSLVFGPTVVVMLALARDYPESKGQVAFGMTFEVCGDKVANAWVMPGMKFDMNTGMPKFNRT